MSFLNKMKRAFGINERDDLEYSGQELLQQPVAESSESSEPRDEKTLGGVRIDVLSTEIFSAVVDLFNEIQPEFVSKCLNTREQSKYILSSIDAGVRKSLEEALSDTRRKVELETAVERKELSAQLEKLKAQYSALEEQRNNFQNEQLSATRQKRALNERVHDLEAQVASLSAEKEQFELESMSMQNKLRALSITMKSENGDSADTDRIQQIVAENARLKEQLAELEKHSNERLRDLDGADKRLKIVREERDRLQADLNTLKMNLDFAEKSERRTLSELSDANDALEELQKKYDSSKMAADSLAKLQIRFDEKERIIVDLRDTNRSLEDRLTSLEHIDSENKQFSGQIKELNESHTRELNAVTKAAEDEIAELKAQLAQKESELNAVRASLAESMTTSADKPKRGRKPKAPKPEQNDKPAKKPTPRISAIDELIDESEWLVAPSPDEKPKTPSTPEEDDDFGYKAPPKKAKMADDSKQLRLF